MQQGYCYTCLAIGGGVFRSGHKASVFLSLTALPSARPHSDPTQLLKTSQKPPETDRLGSKYPKQTEMDPKRTFFRLCWVGRGGGVVGFGGAGSFKHRQVTDLDVTDFGFSGPRIPFCATGALWGRVTPFQSIQAVSWGGQSSVIRGRESQAKNPKSSATKTTMWHCSSVVREKKITTLSALQNIGSHSNS